MAHEYIGLERILQLLGGEKQRRKDEHVCLCPVHGDHKPSLYVKETAKGIVLNCVVGCKAEDICQAIGVKMSELFRDPPRGGGGKPAVKLSTKPANADKPVKTFGSYQDAYGWMGTLVKVYDYRDSRGAVQFEVARILDKDGSKTFRQHRPVKPDGSGKCAFPIRLDVPAELRDHIIYRQAAVEAAVKAGKTVYIVEGEKDADTMERLGLCATTNAGGGGKNKWKEGHTEHLKGAKEVVILPDNDETGGTHAQEVYAQVSKAAKKCYIVDLKAGYPELPPKGDFTDLCEAVGDARAVSILQALVADARTNLWSVAMEAYSNIPGYGIVDRQTCQIVEGNAKKLGNFVALPVEIIEMDNGVQVEKSLKIIGWNMFGRELKPAIVPMNKFKSMDWVMEAWDLDANIMPGNVVKDKLRWIMTEAGNRVAQRRTVYSHCGWRKIRGQWVYLHHGGCIGGEAMQVDMGNNLASYTLGDVAAGMTADAGAIDSYSLTTLLPERISVPLLGVVYLAPLTEFLDQALCPPSFVTALIGEHGTHKTTIASLMLNHFGRFGIRGMPTNFSSTLNSVRQAAFRAKDTLLVVDDYYPATSIQERRKMENIMQVLSRAFGDKANRNRLNADLSLQDAMPARGIALMSGETLPDVGASGQARLYVIELDRGSYQYSRDMDELRLRAEDGSLRKAMASYIEWLLPQADGLPGMLKEMFAAYRRKAHELIAGAATNDRADDAAAHIMIGLTMMLRWMASMDVADEGSIETILDDYWGVVLGNIRDQGRTGKDESPANMFMVAVREMLIAGTVAVADISPGTQRNSTPKGMVGYFDSANYYFLPDAIYGAVVKFYNDQNRVYPLSKSALMKILREDGIVEQWDEKGGRSTKQKIVYGRNSRYLWIPRWRVDGTKSPEHQMAMSDFTEVEDDDLPEQFKEGGTGGRG